MKPEIFERIVAELRLHVPPIRVAVLYHGGEPLLNRHFPAMAGRVKALGIPFVKSVSNGMLIRPENAETIVACGLDAIEISLDGASAAENNTVRRRSDFDRVCRAIHLLVDARRRLGSPIRIFVATTQFLLAERPLADHPAAVPPHMREAFADIAQEIEFKATWAKLWPSEQPAAGYDLLHDDRPRELPTSCSLLDETISIRADGTVVACCYDLTTMSNLGNIATQSLADIWRGEAYRKFRGDFVARNYPELCKGCVVVTGDKYLLQKRSQDPQRTISVSSLASSMRARVRETKQRAE
jgi:radical SAM protein with 4Fe4S-binding SPASM domain